jgi:glutamate dehydrogenase (NAD(P)+)
MAHAYDEDAGVARRERISLRDAALLLSVHRVAEAHRIRGLYP